MHSLGSISAIADDLEEYYVVLDDNVYKAKEQTAEYPSFGSPREVNQVKTLTDHSSNTNIPFDCPDSDSGHKCMCFIVFQLSVFMLILFVIQ
jgi:hypothetical protein